MKRTETPLLKRIGSLLLALVMLWTLMPELTVKVNADAGSDPASLSFAMGMNGVQDYMENGGSYDYVNFGGLKWRVLDTESDAGTGTGTGILLLSENVLNYGQPWNGYRTYSDRDGTPGTSGGDTTLGYSVSDVRAYLVGDASHTYTKFRTGTSLSTGEVIYSIPTYYYYRIEQAPGSYVQPGQLYYTRDAADDAGYVKYAGLTELLFSQGCFYTLDGGVYTKATAFTAGTDYYYDTSEYTLADLGDARQLPTGETYYSFARASSAKAASTDSSTALGTLYYIGYHTTGEGRPRNTSVTRTIVSGKTGADVNFASDYGFTSTELGAVMNTVKPTEYTSGHTYRAGAYTYYGGSLVGDSFFLLSADEANNPGYGFTDNASRIGKDLAGGARYWWLRSSSNFTYPGYVNTSGSFSYYYATFSIIGLRPACNFNRASVIFASAAAGGKSSAAPGGGSRGEAAEIFWENPAPADTNDWKLTLQDGSLSVSADKLTVNDDGTYTLQYSNASESGEGVYLSALLLEGSEAVSYGYGRLLAIGSDEAKSGETSFKLPAGLDLTNCNIKFFLERCNDGSTACDYASAPVLAAVVENGAQEYTGEWKTNAAQHWHENAAGAPVGEKTAHTFTEWTDDRASCDEAGEGHRHCTVCGYEETRSLPAGTHTWENKVEAVEPSCTTPGSYAYYTCSVCGKFGRVDGVDEHDAEIISVHTELQDMQRGALGHLYSSSASAGDYAEVVRDADGNYLSGNVELVHDNSKHWLRYYCVRENCPSKNSGQHFPAYSDEGHGAMSFSHDIDCGTTNACAYEKTLTRNGHSVTLACGYTPATAWAHTPSGSMIRVEYPEGANPCLTPGVAIYKCAKCDEECEGEAYPARGHLWSGTQTLRFPTYDEAGEGYVYCVRCAANEDRSLPQLVREDTVVSFSGESSIPWSGSEVSCGHNSDTDTFSFTHALASDGSATLLDADDARLITTVEWYSGETKLEAAPSELGSYTLKISVPQTDAYNEDGSGKYGYNAAAGEKSFSIVKADQVVPGLTIATAGPEAAENTAKITGSASASVSTSPYESAALSYTSSNPAVAAVNASTGAITLEGAGTTDITAAYAETAHYNAASKTVTLTVLPLSSEANILTFSVAGCPGTVGEDSVSVSVPYTVQLGSVTPAITISAYAQGVAPASGATVAFTPGAAGSEIQTGTYTYTVTAEDGTQKSYTVTVSRALERVTAVTAPAVQYIPDGTAEPIAYLNGNYGSTGASLEGGGSTNVSVGWTLENAEGAAYDPTPGAQNTFRWTATPPAGYNPGSAVYTGTLTITNQAVSQIPQGSISNPGTVTLSGNTALNTVTLTLTLTAGTTGTVTCQWQKSVSGAWQDLSGETGTSLTLANLTMADNGASYRCVVTNNEGGEAAPGVGSIPAAPLAVQKGSQEAPVTAVFSAETMLLTGVDASMEYSTDGANYTSCGGSSVDLSAAVTGACTISVRYAETAYLNASPAQTLAVTKAAAPSVTPVQPTAVGGNGSIDGLDDTMEVSADGSSWTAPAAAYAPGTYTVRVKASGSILPSDAVSVTVLARYAVTGFGDTEHFTVTAIPESALAGSSVSFTVTPDTGYTVAVTVNGEPQAAASTYAVNNISADVEIGFTVSARTYKVQFSTTGSTCEAMNVTFGQPYGTLPATTRTAYRFDGWYLENSYTNLIESTTTVATAGDHILYAKFTAKATLIPAMDALSVFYDGEGHALSPKFSDGVNTVTDGFTVSYKLKDAADDTYTDTPPVDEGAYTVRFVRAEDDDYAAVSQTLDLLEIKPLEISAAALSATAPAYGAAPGSVTTEDTDYTVTGTAWSPEAASFDYDTAYTVTVTLTAKAHRVFKNGFAAKLNGADTAESLSADKKTATVTYIFPNTEKEKFTVTFKNGTETVDTKTVDKGDTLPAAQFPAVPSKSGYTGAWDVTADITNITENKTVSAVYTANTYTLSFNANGGSSVESKTVTYDAAVGALTDSARTGYIFDGWFSGETQYTAETVYQTAGDTELTAHWTAEIYTISYELNGGAYAVGVSNPASYTVEDAVALKAPVKTGYTFSGWTGSNGDTPQTSVSIAQGSTGSRSYTANWTEATDTAYTVKHYQQDLGADTYTLKDTDGKTGTTGANTAAEAKSYEGFTAPNTVTQQPIAADGSTVIEIYYSRNSYKVTYSYTETAPAGAPALPAEAEYEYGASVTLAAAPTLLGYTFNGWSRTGTFTMPATAVEITGGWTAEGDTPYKVEYYLEKLDGSGYDLNKTTPLTGATGSTATAPEDSYPGFAVDKSVSGTLASGTIIAVEDPEDQLTLKLYYKRCSYNVTYSYTGTVPADASALPADESHKYGETVTTAAAASAAGYTFSGWTPEYTEDVTVTGSSTWKSILGWLTGSTSFEMPAGNVRVTGSFTAKTNTQYTVEHWIEKLDGTFERNYSETKFGTTDTDTAAEARTDYVGFDAGTVTNQKIKGDGSTVIRIDYTRHSYTLTWNAGSGSFTDGQTFTESRKFGAAITAPTETPTRTGYTFKEWDGLTDSDTMPAANKSYTALWTANEYLVTYTFTGENVPTGASVPAAENKATDSIVNLPSVAPVNEGGYTYTFNGWSSTDVTISDGSFTMPARAVTVSGTWTKTANTNTPYTVEHWLEKVEGGYELSEADTENKTGVTGANTAAEAKTTYTGFEAKDFDQQQIAGDGTTVVKIYYDRKSYVVSYEFTGTVPEGAAALLPASGGYKYGSSVTVAAAPTLTGYTFSGWSQTESPFVMPAEAVTIKGSWTARGDTAYKAEYYLEKLDSTDSTLYANYAKDETATENCTGATGATATANIKAFDGFAYNADLSTASAAIAADGSLVLKVYYTRSSYTVTYEYTGDVPGGAPETPETKSYRYGATVTVADAPTLTGYTFSGWTPKFTEDAALQGNSFWQRLKNWITGTETFIMPNGSVQITGSFTAAEVNYKVEHYRQDAENPGNYTLYETDDLKGITGTTTEAAAKSYDGFTAQSFTQQTIAGDGTTAVTIKYNRNIYKLSYQYSGTVPAGAAATLPAASEWRYGQAVTVAEDPTLTGYTFSGWDKATGFTMPIDGATAAGTWTPNSYTVKFDANGGEGGMADMGMTYDAAKKLTKNSFTKTGYTFTGWDLDGTHYDDEASVSNLTAEANGTVTLKAQWTANTYTVKFDENGGEGSMDDQTMTYDVAANLTANAFTKTGYAFTGWKLGEASYADEAEVSNLTAEADGTVTLKAQWTANTYTVTFDDSSSDGGTKPENVTATYDTAFTLPENTMTREGHEFEGWALENGGDVKYADKAEVADNLSSAQGAAVTLYPVWSACELVITSETDIWGVPADGDPAATYGPLTAEFRLKDGTTVPAGNISWSIEELPAGVSIDAATGVVTIQPGAEKITLKIKAVHKYGAEAAAEIRLVSDKLIIRADIAGLSVDEGTMWVDGVPYTPTYDGTVAETVVPFGDYHFVTFYSYAGTEYDYCTNMYVWELELDDNVYTGVRVVELDDVMQYQGVSIRVKGIKGMRIFTGVPVDSRKALIGGGLAGYKLLEAGTVVMAGKEDRSIVLSNPSALSGYAYKKGVRDSVFDVKNSLSRYTDTLINFDYEKCKIDYSFRSYMILENEDGEQVELYGGITTRSLSYVAWQNRDEFESGTAAYKYIWDIIINTDAEERYGTAE